MSPRLAPALLLLAACGVDPGGGTSAVDGFAGTLGGASLQFGGGGADGLARSSYLLRDGGVEVHLVGEDGPPSTARVLLVSGRFEGARPVGTVGADVRLEGPLETWIAQEGARLSVTEASPGPGATEMSLSGTVEGVLCPAFGISGPPPPGATCQPLALAFRMRAYDGASLTPLF